LLSPVVLAALLAAVFGTALLSGVFGMMGGVILMGVFTAFMPVSVAMVTHGATQLISNSSRAVIHRAHTNWKIVSIYFFGSLAAGALLALVSYSPSKAWLYLLLGLFPLLTWMPDGWLKLDAAQPSQSLAAGFVVTGTNLMAGGAGPLLDTFFVRTGLTRHQILATKATVQVFSHLAKIVFYGGGLLGTGVQGALPPVWFFVAIVPLAVVGAWVGARIVDAMTDVRFKQIQRWLLTAIALTYLVTSAQLFLSGAHG
jgi:uncharacterized membrane protein YfcA